MLIYNRFVSCVELDAHSDFSFLESASHVDELVLRVRELGYEVLALMDHDGLHGAVRFAYEAPAGAYMPSAWH